MAFDIATTVTDASARSADASSQDEELDDSVLGDQSENVAVGDEDTESQDDGGDDSVEDGRSTHVKRANFDKVNDRLKEREARITELEAAQAKPAEATPDEWEPVRQEFQRLGLNPQAAAAQVAEQKRIADQAAYDQENQNLHMQVAAQIDYNENPAAYDAYFQTLRHSLDLSKQAVYQAKAFAFQQYPDADNLVMDAFGNDPRQIDAIARHTHTRIAGIKAELTKTHAAELETAKKQAVLEYIESQNKNRAAGVERGTTGAVQRTAPARQPSKPGGGLRIPVQTSGRF